MKVNIITNRNDWWEVYVDGSICHSGHSIPAFIWAKLLDEAGAEVSTAYSDFGLAPTAYDWADVDVETS